MIGVVIMFSSNCFIDILFKTQFQIFNMFFEEFSISSESKAALLQCWTNVAKVGPDFMYCGGLILLGPRRNNQTHNSNCSRCFRFDIINKTVNLERAEPFSGENSAITIRLKCLYYIWIIYSIIYIYTVFYICISLF